MTYYYETMLVTYELQNRTCTDGDGDETCGAPAPTRLERRTKHALDMRKQYRHGSSRAVRHE